jgi:hypothetical protein
LHLSNAILRKQTVCLSRIEKPARDFIPIKFLAGDKLVKAEARAIQRGVAGARCRGGECGDFAIERGVAVSGG